jgi:phage-related protein
MPRVKSLEWVGRSQEDLRNFPAAVRRDIGYALYFAQAGDKHPAAKPLRGFGGAGVLEVVEDFDGDTYRAVYTVKFADVVYVLHVFQKKAKKGIATPKQDLELIRKRLQIAEKMSKEKAK